MSKPRLDQELVRRGLTESREKAQRLILAGQVFVDGQPQTKPAHPVTAEAVLSVAQPERFVSRGGEKLEGAFLAFGLDVTGALCLDIGASTGGFTDCLLQHGAAQVYAFDCGRGQLHWKLRQDPRVVVREGVNARYLTAAALPTPAAMAVVDVSFISLTKVLPAVTQLLASGAQLVTLIKPQFEAGRAEIEAGGVVRDPQVHAAVIERVRRFGVEELGLCWVGLCPSPLLGPAGNREFLAYWKKP